MRSWLFHPLIFYPLALAVAAAAILFSLRPQALPREPAAVAGRVEGETLVLERAAFDAPEDPPEQHVTIVRDFWGAPQSLRIAVLPGQNDPTAGESGVFIGLDPASAALISGKPLSVDVTYRPLSVNAASQLAISVQGSQPTRWVGRPIPPLADAANFTLPRARDVRGIGLRAIGGGADQAYGVEIVSIRITPQPPRPRQGAD
jgi:hypothetical protein